MDTKCYECQRPIAETRLLKCPICHRHFCDDHGYVMSGRSFCTYGCAVYFFFGEPDD